MAESETSIAERMREHQRREQRRTDGVNCINIQTESEQGPFCVMQSTGATLLPIQNVRTAGLDLSDMMVGAAFRDTILIMIAR